MNGTRMAAILIALSLGTCVTADSRPNVILIFTDDQGYQDLGCFGSPNIKTPNLDRMAAEGVRLTSFYAQPVCGVSRAALMTGCYPIRIAEPDNIKRLHTVPHPSEVTMAEVLKQAGYATGLIGKWHLAADRKDSPGDVDPATMPNAQGFDYFYGTPKYNGSTVFVSDTKARSPILRNQEVVVDAVESWDHITADYTREATNWIRANHQRPFFLYLAHNMPHVPLGASERFKGKSEGGLYGDTIEEIDWSCGEIFSTLKELDIDDNTLVVFTSDNGPWVETTRGMKPRGKKFIPRDHSGNTDPLRGWKMSAWEGGSRVPFIARWPGKIPPGWESDQLLSTMDLLPTFASIANAELPGVTLDGVNAAAFLTRSSNTSPREDYFYYAGCLLTGVRSGPWKLVLPRAENPPGLGWWGRMIEDVSETMLFHLDDDPGEAINVAQDHPEVVAALLERIEAARNELGDIGQTGTGARLIGDGPRRLQVPARAPSKPQSSPKHSKTSATDSQVADRPPNFVIIFTDDQGYADIGCFGSPDIRTPRLDAMAREGMKFTDFYAQPICGPSRAALMTGCYPMRVAERGILKQIHPILHEQEVTVAEVLKTRGYATACIGKWDLATHSQTRFLIELFPTRQGFDEFFGTPTSNDSVVNLFRGEELIEPKSDMATLTQRYTDEAIDFMSRHRDQPFFVYLPHSMPHTRLDATDRFKGRSKRGLYGDVIEEIDFNVGRILDSIRELGLAENTYVLMTSDNGPWLSKNKDFADGHLRGDHGGSAGPLRSGKVSTFEGGVRVPAILWGPGRVPAGTTCDKIASTLDVLPTFAALAGAKPPEDRVIDGADIRHLFHGEFDKADPGNAYFYYLRMQLQAVRQGRWKLHLPREKEPNPFTANPHIAPADRAGFDKLFLVDLATDVGETTNVASEHPQVVQRLQSLADAIRKDLGDEDRVGENMRFFDLPGERPTKPPVPNLVNRGSRRPAKNTPGKPRQP